MATPTVVAHTKAVGVDTSSTGNSPAINTTGATKITAFVVGQSNTGISVADSNTNGWAAVTSVLTAFAQSSVRIRLYDVVAGTYSTVGTYANTGTHTVTVAAESVVVCD